jgi:DNA excision repair protein ERCC-4
MRKQDRPKLTIIKDTREQQGYSFANIKPKPKIINEGLKSGDYSIQGMEDEVAIERKSKADAFQSFGRNRKRFERELVRLSKMSFAAVVVEADWAEVLNNPPKRTRLSPKVLFVSRIAWEQRYGIHFWFCFNREFAEKTTYRILERFYLDKIDGRKN